MLNLYSEQEYIDVNLKDDDRVEQVGAGGYVVHQFKDYVGNVTNACTVEWEGQSSISPISSAVFLQIYNVNSESWDTLTSNNSADADTDFTLIKNITDLGDYRDGEIITCRVYQSGE